MGDENPGARNKLDRRRRYDDTGDQEAARAFSGGADDLADAGVGEGYFWRVGAFR